MAAKVSTNATTRKKFLTPLDLQEALRATGSKLVDYWPVSYRSTRGPIEGSKPEKSRCRDIHSTIEHGPTKTVKATNKLSKRKRVADPNTEVHPLKAQRSCQERGKRKPHPGSISFTDVPTELVSNVLDFCAIDDILALGQVSRRFRQICSNPYLCHVGIIIKNSNGAVHIRLVGQPFSPSAVAFLREVNLCFPRISLICDLFHAISFSSDILRFLQNHSIQGLEILFLEDELDILEDLSFSVVIHRILTAIPSSCTRVSFSAHVGKILRTLPTPRRTTSSPLRPSRHLKVRKQMESVTEFRLSSIFSRVGPLWGVISRFLQMSAIEAISLDCDTPGDPWRILQSMTFPCLEMLSIVTRADTLPLFPNSFNRFYSRLKFLSILNFHSWDTPDSLRLPTVHLSFPASLSHLTISSNYSSFEIQDITELSRLDIVSFMTAPIPENRGYCKVVKSLTQALRLSTGSSQQFSTSLTVSFTFPRFLDAHIRFCEKNPIYRCSCSPLSLKDRPVKDIRSIEIQADVLSNAFMGYVNTWIRQFPRIVYLNIITDTLSITLQLPPLSSLRLHCQELLEVTFTCGGEKFQTLK